MFPRVAARLSSFLGGGSKARQSLLPLYEEALNLSRFGRGIPWAINGIRFRIDARCRSAMPHKYDVAAAALFRASVKRGATCFDIGANVGIYALQWAEWSKPDGKLVAFEPNPAAVKVLKRHVAMNGLQGRVTIVEKALSDAPGLLDFYAAGSDGMSRLGAPNPLIAEDAKPIQVAVTTVDEYVDQAGYLPDAMLVDVEGFEFHVLAGARRTISRCPNLILVVEMHPNAWASAGMDARQAAGLLRDLKLTLKPLTGQHRALEEYGHVRLLRAAS